MASLPDDGNSPINAEFISYGDNWRLRLPPLASIPSLASVKSRSTLPTLLKGPARTPKQAQLAPFGRRNLIEIGKPTEVSIHAAGRDAFPGPDQMLRPGQSMKSSPQHAQQVLPSFQQVLAYSLKPAAVMSPRATSKPSPGRPVGSPVTLLGRRSLIEHAEALKEKGKGSTVRLSSPVTGVVYQGPGPVQAPSVLPVLEAYSVSAPQSQAKIVSQLSIDSKQPVNSLSIKQLDSPYSLSTAFGPLNVPSNSPEENITGDSQSSHFVSDGALSISSLTKVPANQSHGIEIKDTTNDNLPLATSTSEQKVSATPTLTPSLEKPQATPPPAKQNHVWTKQALSPPPVGTNVHGTRDHQEKPLPTAIPSQELPHSHLLCPYHHHCF